jgi:hypothetical protein
MLAGAVLVIAGLALTTGIIKLPTPAAPLA